MNMWRERRKGGFGGAQKSEEINESVAVVSLLRCPSLFVCLPF
jgi:hypothetical protein